MEKSKELAAGIPSPVSTRVELPKKRSWGRYAALVAGALLLVAVVPWDSASRHPRHPPRPPLPADKAEELFLTVPDAASALGTSRIYGTHPHLAGSTEDFDDAQVVLQFFQDELGIPPTRKSLIYKAGSHESRRATLGLTSKFGPKHPTAWIDTYFPLLNTPLNRTLQLLGKDDKVIFTADLVEDGDPQDPDAGEYRDAVPTWHGLSFDGEATGEYVYANYGTQEDYAELVSKGVDLKGKIVIARYGLIFRGLKIKGAQELGAAGVLIYSDTRDDGHVTEANGYATYPYGPARNPTSVQRGSVQFLSLYPGDPTTPGYPSYEDAERQEGSNIPKIPSLPISWANAVHFFPQLRDGSEPDSYPVINGKVSKDRIKLVNHVDTKVTPIWNTMAAIPGHIRDEVVVLGCHRDAWVLGAADPISGTVSLLEIVRGLGTLLKQGWKPLRTIVIASWDGEEYGLVGSTEWGEDFERWISRHVVSYLNVDVSVAGSQWNVGGSPSLADLIKRSASDVPHPTEPGKTLWDARNDKGPFKGKPESFIGPEIYYGNASMMSEAPESEVVPLGSGSDYTVFLQRIGVASTDQGFGGTDSDAPYHYHSVYDSQMWQEVYADPTFERHVAVAKHLGLLALRLTDSIILPLNTTRYAFELDRYLDRVETLIPDNFPASESKKVDFSDLRKSIKTLQDASSKLDEEKVDAEKKFRELLDKLPKHPPPPPHHPPPAHGCHGGRGSITQTVKHYFFRFQDTLRSLFGLGPLHPRFRPYHPQTAQEHLGFTLAIADRDDHPEPHPDPHPPRHPPHPFPSRPFPIHKFILAAKRVQRANKALRSFEKGFISKEGIKDREWYKHLGVAPGKWLGYGATTLPALTEAVTIEKNVTLVEYEAGRLTELVGKLAEEIRPRKCGRKKD